jgi:pimeloyl-ACP methyl ester carboxylesterase
MASAGTVIGLSVAGRVAGGVARRLAGRHHRPDGEALGYIRGEPSILPGPRASRIYSETFGGRGGTLLFTHDWCMTEAVWHYQKEALGSNPCTVVTWDLPGHGQSSPLARGHLSLDLAVDALARVVDRATDGPLILVGHSLGGVLTLRYLATNPDTARERVAGAVLASTPIMHLARSVAGRWPVASLEARVLGQALQYVVGSPTVDRFLSSEIGRWDRTSISYQVARTGFGRAPSPAHVRFVRDLIATVPPEVRVDTYRALTGYDVSRILDQIEVPALVMLGTRDRLVNPAQTRALAEGLPHARAVEFVDAGHAVFLERAEEFNGELADFARDVFGGRRGSRRAAGRRQNHAGRAGAGDGAMPRAANQGRGRTGGRPGRPRVPASGRSRRGPQGRHRAV